MMQKETVTINGKGIVHINLSDGTSIRLTISENQDEITFNHDETISINPRCANEIIINLKKD